MFCKFKTLLSKNAICKFRYLSSRSCDNKDYIKIIGLKRLLEKNTKNIKKYKVQIKSATKDVKNELMNYHTCIEYLYFDSDYLVKLHNKKTLQKSYEKLVKERNELCKELRKLDAVDVYLHVTKDYTEHIYK